MNVKNPLHTLCVFCGSSNGNDPIYPQAAIALANAMIGRHISLVYGGGGKGLMGLVASTVYNRVPKVTGIIPERLYAMVKDIQHQEDELMVVADMHERKAAMYRLSDAFVALPGGVGTIEEVMETFTWLHLGYHHKPVALLNANGYFDYLLRFLEHTVTEGFLKQEFLESLVVDSDPERLLDNIGARHEYSAKKRNWQALEYRF